MTQQPFSRPGAVDLSALKNSAPAQPVPPAAGPAGTEAAAAGSSGSGRSVAYSVEVDEPGFQAVVEASMTAPVVLVFYSRERSPESVTMARDVGRVIEGYDGRFLAGFINIDTNPTIAQQMQIAQVPLMLVLIDGRPATQPIQGAISKDDIQTLFQQLGQQLTAQGVTGRHQPRSEPGSGANGGENGDESPTVDPRYAPAQEALEAGDIDRAVAEYQKLVDGNPADTEAAAGLAMAKVLQRTQGADLNAARDAAAKQLDDVDAQTLVADLDLLGGHVDDAFGRLVELVRRTSGSDRDRAREHLLGLFAAVGNEDPRVLKGRQLLASALF